MNIDHWDESIEVSFKNVKDIMAKAKHKKTSPVETEDLLRELDKLFKRIQDLTKSYRREMLQIVSANMLSYPSPRVSVLTNFSLADTHSFYLKTGEYH